MQALNIDEVLAKILANDPRYRREAYLFLRDGLDYAQKQISKTSKNEIRHITGQELLQGLRQFALSQFGPMAATVLDEWGVHRCEDFGDLVFNMVEHGLLSKTEKDSREDFKGGYDFDEAFRKPFRPSGQAAAARAPQTKSSEA